MAEVDNTSPLLIKRYASRRLYNTETSDYVTLEDVAVLIRKGRQVQIVDLKSGDDLTRQYLLQIIAEHESRGENVLPIEVLTDLVRSYTTQAQSVVPQFLAASFEILREGQSKLMENMSTFPNPMSKMPGFEALQRQQQMFLRAMMGGWKLPYGTTGAAPGDGAEDGVAVGTNTDAGGFYAPLAGFDFAGRPVTVIGELYQQQSISRRQLAEAGVTPPGEAQNVERYLIKVGNREREGQDFRTLLASDIRSQSTPRSLLVLERDSHGTAYGYLAGLLEDGQPLTGRNLGQALQQRLPQIAALSRQAHDIQFRDMARINQQFDALRLREKRLQRDDKLDARAQDAIKAERLELQRQYQLLSERLAGLNRDRQRDALLLRDMHGQTLTIPLSQVRDAWYPNAMSTTEKLTHWGEQVKKFLTDSPREANTEGGVFPAIFGTVLMVILMSIVVMPFGVIAALYLHEYAGNNLLTRVIRIAVVNLAGVPSIVYGVFGLGFFVYMIGGTLDQLFYPESLPNPTFGTPGVLEHCYMIDSRRKADDFNREIRLRMVRGNKTFKV